MTLPSLLTKHDQSDTFVQPQLTRYHHAYRSPMSSEQLNLEAAQLRFDFYMIYAQLSQLVSDIDIDFNVIQNGSGSSFYSVSWNSDATPSPVNTLLTSLQAISQRLQRLDSRLQILERGM